MIDHLVFKVKNEEKKSWSKLSNFWNFKLSWNWVILFNWSPQCGLGASRRSVSIARGRPLNVRAFWEWEAAPWPHQPSTYQTTHSNRYTTFPISATQYNFVTVSLVIIVNIDWLLNGSTVWGLQRDHPSALELKYEIAFQWKLKGFFLFDKCKFKF